MMQNTLNFPEPKAVFRIFSEITQIPHGSGNTGALRDYCASLAEKAGLEAREDDAGNLFFCIPAAPGYETHPSLLLQGHLDMVCEKRSDKKIDFTKEGLTLCRDGDFLFADGTTLGADDGIAVAMLLALLEEKDLKNPPLEILLTSDEETGMDGANGFDCSALKSRMLLNLDSEDASTLWVSCAGGVRANVTLPVKRVITDAPHAAFFRLSGLSGGHSGTEIDKGHPNAVLLLREFLSLVKEETDCSLAYFMGGKADNAIPREAAAGILYTKDKDALLTALTAEFEKHLRESYPAEENLTLSVRLDGEMTAAVLTDSDLERILSFLKVCPNGVQAMSREIDGLVETSLNLGILKLGANELTLSFAVRSAKNSEKDALCALLCSTAGRFGGKCSLHGSYPAWEYRKISPLRDILAEAIEAQNGKKPEIKAIHAGLECGIFYGKIPGLDCVSYGPDIFDIHTPEERLSVSSTQSVYSILKAVLSRL